MIKNFKNWLQLILFIIVKFKMTVKVNSCDEMLRELVGRMSPFFAFLYFRDVSFRINRGDTEKKRIGYDVNFNL